MTKRILMTVLILTTLGITNSYSQCIPDSIKWPGIYPDTLVNLDSAIVGVPYEVVMTAVIPKDTFVFGKSIPVDSIGIISFKGLPYGFSYEPNTTSGYWYGGTNGCVQISGMPYDTQIGVYPLDITVRAFVGGLVSDYAVPGYRIILDYTASVRPGLSKQNNILIHADNGSGYATIFYRADKFKPSVLQIFNTSGLLMHEQALTKNCSSCRLSVYTASWNPGLYLVTLSGNHHIRSAKFINN